MKRVTKTNRLQKCSELDIFDFKPWKEKKIAKVSVNDQQSHVKSVKN
jgi:hypothetical protein